MSGSADNAAMRVALVIGIHHRELEYGQKVADLLIDSNIQMLRIDEGLPQQMEYGGKSFYYSTYLREIYLQVHQQIKNKIDLLIDLHTGINEAKRCADIYCNNIRLLDSVHDLLAKKDTNKRFPDSGPVHFIQITDKDTGNEEGRQSPVCHTTIPRLVWTADEYRYVGLEIYLQDPGKGKEADWRYGSRLINTILKAAKQ